MSDYNGPNGHPTDAAIAAPIKVSASAPSVDQSATDVATTLASNSSRAAEAVFGPLCLSPEQIAAPAFFVDRHLSIRWMAPGGEDPFSLALALQLESTATRDAFNLLLRTAIKHALTDWQAFFSFIYTRLRRFTTDHANDAETGFISRDYLAAGRDESMLTPDSHLFSVDSCILGGDGAATGPPWRIFGLEFAEGTLFLLRRDRWYPEATALREYRSGADENGSADIKPTFCVLSLRFDDSNGLADTMLPEFLFQLMNRIWDEADDMARALGGKRAGCSASQCHYIFSEGGGRNPIFSAICCATRINDQMQVLGKQLREQQGWADEICMNMGISHGMVDPMESDPASTMEFMIPGGTLDQAVHLAAIAGKREIWITKNAVVQLPEKRINQVVMGVDRQGRFLRNFFTRLADLSQENGHGQIRSNLGSLSIARIIKLEPQRPDQPVTKEV